MLVTALGFVLLTVLPVDFPYMWFALVLLMMGVSMGVFAAPNRAGIMNSLPPNRRGAGAGVANTFQNSAQVLSIGVFFSLIIAGLSSSLPSRLFHGLVGQGVPASTATTVSHLPAVSSLFAAFLGYNPIQKLLGGSLSSMPASKVAYLTGRSFFPRLISTSFQSGLHEAFYFAAAMCVLAAASSWLRGGKYIHGMSTARADEASETIAAVEELVPVGVTERAPAPSRAAGGGGS
jgi:hypothetical protein